MVSQFLTQQIKRWKEKLIDTGSLSQQRPGQSPRVSASGDDTIEKNQRNYRRTTRYIPAEAL